MSATISILFSPYARALPTPPPRIIEEKEIRVLLGTFPHVNLSGLDLVFDGTQKFDGNNSFGLRCGRRAGLGYIEFGSGRKNTEQMEITSPSGFFRISRKLYRNRLTIIPRENGCAVVNTLGIEKYLAGLINREMAPHWPLEALKAQAVASRSYAIHQMQLSRSREYDLESTTQDQVYDGADSETPRSSQAVEITRGQVLFFGTSTVKAYFHSNCGGITEVPEFVWGGEAGGFRPVVCPYHREKRNQQRWSLRLSKGQIENALRKISGLIPHGFLRLAHLEAGAPDASNRLNDVMLSDTVGNAVLVSATAFRNALGNTRVKSTSFQVAEAAEAIELKGDGYGHGVGMCQVGARAMAEEGKSYREILSYYYPLAKIQSL